jgi:hypothetical protein
LSNLRYPEDRIDPPSERWLGKWASSAEIQASGLWNVNHVDENYEPNFLSVMEELIFE